MLKYGLIRYFLASGSLTRLVLQEKLTSGKKPKKGAREGAHSGKNLYCSIG